MIFQRILTGLTYFISLKICGWTGKFGHLEHCFHNMIYTTSLESGIDLLILTNEKTSVYLIQRMLRCYVNPVQMYGREIWTLTKQLENLITATGMWFIRKILKASWTEKKSLKRESQNLDTTSKV